VVGEYKIGVTQRKKREFMDTIKIMPCLDMKEGRVVKGIHFVDLKHAGDPVENAILYQKNEPMSWLCLI